MGAVVGGAAVGQRCRRIATDQPGKGVGRRKSRWRSGRCVVGFSHAAVADRGRQRGRGDAGAGTGTRESWRRETVVAGHTGGGAGRNREAWRAAGADAGGRCHVGRVVVDHQGAGVECKAVPRNGASEITLHRSAAGPRGAVIDLGGRLDGGGGAECFCNDARAVCHGNARPGKTVITEHTGDGAGANREAGCTTGADAVGRCHVGRVVVELQCAVVEQQSVTRHRATDAATDRRCTRHRAAVIGFAQAAGDAGSRSQSGRCDRRRYILAGRVESIVADSRVITTRNAGDGQARHGHLAGGCNVGAVIGDGTVAERCGAVASDQPGNGVGRCKSRRYSRCSVVGLVLGAVAEC